MKSLKLAEESTSTSALLDAFSQLRELLAHHDECEHVVTVRRPIPAQFVVSEFAEQVKDYIDDPDAILAVSEDGYLTLTMSQRGSHDCVQRCVTVELEAGISNAKYALGMSW